MTILDQPIVWSAGALVDRLDVADRGLAYGDGLFETMRCENGVIPLLDRHLQRLALGCEALSIKEAARHIDAAVAHLKTDLASLSSTESHGSYIIKLILTRGLGGGGYLPSQTISPPTIVLRATPYSPDIAKQTAGVGLILCRWRLALNPGLAGIKHLNRLEYVLASQELIGKEGVQGLLTDPSSRVVESLHHNIFLVNKGRLITPKITLAGVKGVMRALIMESLAEQIGAPVLEQELGIDDVMGADEVFLCNSVHGIWPVNEFLGHSWSVGPITRRLQGLIDQMWCSDGH